MSIQGVNGSGVNSGINEISGINTSAAGHKTVHSTNTFNPGANTYTVNTGAFAQVAALPEESIVITTVHPQGARNLYNAVMAGMPEFTATQDLVNQVSGGNRDLEAVMQGIFIGEEY